MASPGAVTGAVDSYRSSGLAARPQVISASPVKHRPLAVIGVRSPPEDSPMKTRVPTSEGDTGTRVSEMFRWCAANSARYRLGSASGLTTVTVMSPPDLVNDNAAVSWAVPPCADWLGFAG